MEIRLITSRLDSAVTAGICVLVLLTPMIIPVLVTGLRALYCPWIVQGIGVWKRPLFLLLFLIIMGALFISWGTRFLPRSWLQESPGTEWVKKKIQSSPVSGGSNVPGDSVHGSSGASPLWSYLDASTDSKQKAVITAAPTVAYDMLLVSQVKGQGGQLTALPLDVPAGQVPEPKWICPTDLRLYESAQVWNGLAFFVDGAAGEANRKLYCVNLFEQGRIEWTRGILPFSTGFATAAAGEVFVQDEPGMLRSLNRAGHEQWALPLGELSVPVGVTGTMVIAAVRQPSFLVVLDRLTGRVLGTRSITKEIQGELSCDGNKIYIGTNAGVVQYDLAGLGAEP